MSLRVLFRSGLLSAGVALLGTLPGCGGGGGGGGGGSAPAAPAPTITTQPAAATAAVGAQAVFTGAASGSPTPTLQWNRSNDGGKTWSAIAGQTGATYTLAAATPNDNNARFQLVATNSGGSTASSAALLTVTASVGQATQVPLTANSAPLGLAAGPDGNMWFTYQSAGAIGVMQAISHAILTVPLTNTSCQPTGIAVGPDGRMWFTELATGNIGAINLDGTHQVDYPSLGLKPTGITQGPDLALWYTLPGSNLIGRMTPGGTATTFPVTTAASGPQGITSGTDGNLWFTEQAAGRIARITPAGTVTEWAIPTPSGGKAPSPQGIIARGDGTLWFADLANNQLVKFQPPVNASVLARPRGPARARAASVAQASGASTASFTTVALPANAQPMGVTLDGNGNLWAADQGTGQVTQISATGTPTTFTLPTTTGQPTNVAIGSDGNLFVTQPVSSTISQVVAVPPSATVDIGILPTQLTVQGGSTAQFTLQVTGAPDTTATWSVQEGAAGGTVSNTGLYTAPAAGGTYHVIATSKADTSQTCTAIVTVLGTGTYSNASLDGPWMVFSTGYVDAADGCAYILFDGQGGITAVGVTDASTPAGSYAVTSSGAVTMTLNFTGALGAYTFTGSLLAPGVLVDAADGLSFFAIPSAAACQGTWHGTFVDAAAVSHTLAFTVGPNGAISGFSGLAGPVSGYLFGYATSATGGTTLCSGLFSTGAAFPDNQIECFGALTGDSLTALVIDDNGNNLTLSLTLTPP